MMAAALGDDSVPAAAQVCLSAVKLLIPQPRAPTRQHDTTRHLPPGSIVSGHSCTARQRKRNSSLAPSWSSDPSLPRLLPQQHEISPALIQAP